MTSTTGWVIGLLVLVIGGAGVYWAYSASQHDAMMQKDAMTSSSDSMMHGATSSDSMMHSTSSDSMMQH